MRKLAAACNNKTPEYEKRSRIEPLAVPRTLARQTRGPWTVSADPRRRLSTCGSERQAAEKMRSCNMLIACDASKEPGFHPHQCLKHSLRRGHAKWIQRPSPTQQEFAQRLEGLSAQTKQKLLFTKAIYSSTIIISGIVIIRDSCRCVTRCVQE